MESRFNPSDAEARWQRIWEEAGTFRASDEIGGRPKTYVLEMFPYPSGRLHVGHGRNYVMGDVLARARRAQGHQVLHPMGWDAFGMPAENAAFEKGIHPETWTRENIATMREQLKALGLAVDWSREFATCDPEYYGHEQALFLDLFEAGLVYRKESEVNWDPVDRTVLANEQVIDGRGWRSGAPVERRKLAQWFLKITAFADELLDGLATLDKWPDKVRLMQENWIGKSRGLRFRFRLAEPVAGHEAVEVFTTRPDTIFGASFVALSPDHPLARALASEPENADLRRMLDEAGREDAELEVDGVAVLVSERTGPAAMGVLRGRVVLPRWALGLEPAQRRLMVLHEAEHVRAGDPQLALAGLVVCALMPWNVAAWWQLGRLRLALEMDCDARVLARSDDVRSYGSLLLEVGQRRGAGLAVGLAETRSSLERRIRMMTRTTTGRRTLRALGLAVASAGVLVMACETPGPTEVGAPGADEVELREVRGILSERAAPGGADCDPAVYLNGSRYEGDVDALDADRIDHIEIYKTPAAREAGAGESCGLILIVMKDATAEELEAVRRLKTEMEARRPTRTLAEVAAAPTFTPMTRRPSLKNPEAVRSQLEAEYPPLLRNAGIGGAANVWFLIGPDGAVERLMINEGSGHQALDEAALRVAATMEFTPAYLNDEPVQACPPSLGEPDCS